MLGRAIVETAFDIAYLVTVVVLGILMIIKSKGNKQYCLFGIMAVVLGFGDAFHLVPRAIALCADDMSKYAVAMGVGKFITSITMTVFYVLLYYVWRIRYQVKGKTLLTVAVYALAILRIALCICPQNKWWIEDAPLMWGIYRNIPFTIFGILIIVLFLMSAYKQKDRQFRFMWLTIVLSFAFYIPVVIWAKQVPLLGLLMIPKTCAYVWTVVIGYLAMKKDAMPKVKDEEGVSTIEEKEIK